MAGRSRGTGPAGEGRAGRSSGTSLELKRKAFRRGYPEGRAARHTPRGPSRPLLRGEAATGESCSTQIPAPIVRPWQETIAQTLRAVHLNSLRSRLLVLALGAPLIPTLGRLASLRAEPPALGDTVARELRSVSSEAARRADVWLDERLSDLRVAGGSFVLSENLARIRPGTAGRPAAGPAGHYPNLPREA